VVITAWSFLTSFAVFYYLKKKNILRVEQAIEILGLDYAQMGAIDQKTLDKFQSYIRKNGSEAMSLFLMSIADERANL